jgi:two-component system cell cycle sensor histidine kinase/response regulator CckA
MQRRLWVFSLLVGLLAIGCYFVLSDPWSSAAYDGCGVAAAFAFWFGPRAAGSRRTWCWRLLAIGLLLFAAGDIESYFVTSFPSSADGLYLVGYGFLAAGIVGLAPRVRRGGVGVGLDAALATTAASMFVLLFWLEPLVSQGGMPSVAQAVSCAYPVADLLLLTLLVRGLLSVAVRTTAYRLLMLGMLFMLTSDFVYTGLLAHGAYSASSWVNGGWIASYALFAAAALHPSIAAAPEPVGSPSLSWGRLSLIGACLVSPSMALALQFAFSDRVEAGDLVVFGTVIGILGFARLTLVVLERQRSEQQFRSMIENGSDVILILSGEGCVEYLSPSAERIFGLPVEHCIGQSGFDLVHADDREEAAHVLSRVLAGGTEETECRMLTGDGSYRRMASTARPIESGPHAGGVLLNGNDVTDRHAMKMELAKKDDQLHQAQKMEAVGQLAGGVAHDFNNLLTAIHGYGEFAQERATKAGLPQLQSDIGEILRSADRASGLTRQLLAFSRQRSPESLPLDLNELIGGTDKLLRRLIGEDIDFVTLFADVPCWVKADLGQLEQVVVNLVLNARDAMPAGGSLVIAVDAEEGTVLLTVSDTGHGIDAETQGRIFEPFYTTKQAGQGTGLGLALVYGTVTNSGGAIEVDSSPVGTTFTIRLPRTHARTASTHTEDMAETSGMSGRILLVEDEPAVREVAARILRKAGYDVLEANEGAEGLRIATQEISRIDLLLTDVVMPQLSGTELAERVRLLSPQLPVIYCSGYMAGALDDHPISNETILAKPFTSAALLAAVRTAMTSAVLAA